MISRKLIGSVLALSALTLAFNTAHAKSDSAADTAYEGAPSGIDPDALKDMIT